VVDKGDVFKPGEKVPHSGIYRVIHDPNHPEEHDITCIYGYPFPPCNHCGQDVRFVLKQPAHHIDTHKHFK
jgi:hypothetical protein